MEDIRIRAKKSLGQNFLIDHEALSDIAESLEIAGNHIIEVGPGYGALTDYILESNPASLDLVELDTDMVKILQGKFNTPNLTLHHQDVLTYRPSYENYSVVANIPYYITSPILFHFLYPELQDQKKSQKQEIRGKEIFSKGTYSNVSDGENNFFNDEVRRFSDFSPPDEMVIMMQKEVGEKILEGRARKPHHSLLSLAMEQACDDIELIRLVGRASFSPPPKVDSIVLKFTGKKNRDRSLEKKLISLWKVAFAHPRKTLLSNIKGSTYSLENIRKTLTEIGYDDRVRAEAVKKEDWVKFL